MHVLVTAAGPVPSIARAVRGPAPGAGYRTGADGGRGAHRTGGQGPGHPATSGTAPRTGSDASSDLSPAHARDGAADVVATVAGWWSGAAPGTRVTTAALAGGGAGFLDALAGPAPDVVAVSVRRPLDPGPRPAPGGAGRPGPGAAAHEVGHAAGHVAGHGDDRPRDVAWPGGHDTSGDLAVTLRLAPGRGGARTAYVEAARAAGPALVPAAERWSATSAGIGELLAAGARAVGPGGRVVLATGGVVTHDAGTGLVAALAGGPCPPAMLAGARGLAGLTADDRTALEEAVARARAALAGVDLVAATDRALPLLGLHGASAALQDDGVDAATAQQLERDTGHVVHLLERAGDRARPSLLAGTAPGGPGRRPEGSSTSARTLATLPGAGSGGGLAFATALLGGRLLPGLGVVADAVDLSARTAEADLVVVVVEELDAHELHDGLVPEVARRAADHAVPVVVLAGASQAGRREWSAAGVSGVYAVRPDPAVRTGRVARTWSV